MEQKINANLEPLIKLLKAATDQAFALNQTLQRINDYQISFELNKKSQSQKD